jgi:lysyl-tRNA synthetase, class II
MAESNEYVEQRLKKLDELRESGIEVYPYSYNKTHNASEILEKYTGLDEGEETKDSVSVAGRIMTLRSMGKAGFAHIQDETGKIQIYVRKDEISEESFNVFSKIDLGDIIGIKGTVFRTKKGEVSIRVKEFVLLSKCVRPLPEKWHGLKDKEARYRKRYLDLITNPEVKKTFVDRTKIINAIKEFLVDRGFLEVDTPVLQPVYGGASARPFKSFLNELKMDVYMRVSNELYLKRLIVGGFEKVFEFSKDFRNEGIDRTHNPEFMMMECYWAYADYQDVMKLTEDCYEFVAKKVFGTTEFNYQGNKIDVKAPWERITMKDAIKKFTKIDVDALDDADLKKALKENNVELAGDYKRGYATIALFEDLVEDKLVQPTFVIDHPKESTPLCKVKRGDDEMIERFEPYICGMEIGNAYSELNDPIKQKELLEEQALMLKKGDDEANPMDEDFVESMEYGMPPTGGLGLGIDRMVMLMTDSPSIRDVILFPFMRPEE